MVKKPVVSIIIVHYRVEKELVSCIDSIQKSHSKVPYEIIVVDNDGKSKIENKITSRFPKIRYIKSEKNRGYGGGNNLGVKYARGTYLFFLNPDTYFYGNPLDSLVSIFKTEKKLGIVAPLLLNPQKNPYPLQGSLRLTPIRAIFAFSILNTFFPYNPVSKNYWMLDWDKKSGRYVDTVPGTAFIISKSLFQKIGGFDEQFFLYFEEEDLCRRVASLGYMLYIDHKAKIIHYWGISTKQFSSASKIFYRSRFLFFKKHFGVIWAYILTICLKRIHV